MVKRRKILYIITKGVWGGAGRYVFDLATNLPKDGYEAVVAMGGSEEAKTGALTERLAEAGIRTAVLQSLKETRRAGPQIGDMRAFFELLALLRRERPDVVHLNSSRVGVMGGLATRLYNLFSALRNFSFNSSTQIVFTIHGWPFKESRTFFVQNVLWLASYITALLTNKLIAVSRDDYEWAEYMPGVARKVTHISNGIKEIDMYSRDEARAALTKVSEQRELLWVGTVGELTPNKGHEYLIEAVASLPMNVLLCIVGDGAAKQALLRKSNELNVSSRILFVQSLPEAARYLSAFDIFAFPSLKEGLSYALLEAGMAGCSVVASDIPGNREIISDESLGVLVPPRDVRGLADAITSLMGNSERRVETGNKLAERVRTNYNFESMLGKTTEVYM